MFSYELFEMYRESKGYNQLQCATALGFKQPFVTKLRKGTHHLNTEIAFQIADELNLNHEEVLLKLQAEKAKEGQEQDSWEKILKKLGSGQILSLGSLTAMFYTHAGIIHTIAHNVYYVK